VRRGRRVVGLGRLVLTRMRVEVRGGEVDVEAREYSIERWVAFLTPFCVLERECCYSETSSSILTSIFLLRNICFSKTIQSPSVTRHIIKALIFTRERDPASRLRTPLVPESALYIHLERDCRPWRLVRGCASSDANLSLST
jgi:hypothetical protein